MSYQELPEAGFTVYAGIDVLVADEFRGIGDRHLGLLTNHTGTTLDGRRTIDVLRGSEDVLLDVLFAPERGLDGRGADGVDVEDGEDDTTGLPVFGVFGTRDRPEPAQLHGLDLVLVDLADIGCRFTTLPATLGGMLEACAEAGVRVLVLDRPNPIGGYDVEGPCSDADAASPVNYHPLPLRHGLTIGELARLFNGERDIGADLRIATMAGWRRDLLFDQTGRAWADPLPGIQGLTAAVLFPGVGLLEETNLSVGRGTREPYRIVGAPWMDADEICKRLAAAELPGLTYETIEFAPNGDGAAYAGERCGGVRFVVGDNAELAPASLGLALIKALRSCHRDEWAFEGLDMLLARPDLLEAIEDGAEELDDLWHPDPEFLEIRAKYLLY